MAITAVGTLASGSAAANATQSINPTAGGNMFLLYTKTSSATVSATGVSGGNCATWVRVHGPTLDSAGTASHSMFMGIASATGAATATVTFSASIAGVNNVIGAQQFTSPYGAATRWIIDQNGFLNNASATTVTYPTLVPSGVAELYFGHARTVGTASAGATSGFTYALDANTDPVCYNGNVAASVAPTQPTTAGASYAMAAIIQARPKEPTMVTAQAISRASNW